jgi:SAM-dependent methyltransferase
MSHLYNSKQKIEAQFWQNEIQNYIYWYNGVLKHLYFTPSPSPSQKSKCDNLIHSAILTWTELHQKPKYLNDLQLRCDIFKNKKVLDVGSGPIPSATCFDECILYCLDPLHSEYKSFGFPQSIYKNVNFIESRIENTPIEDDFFDAIISVNAIDHVDDLYKTAKELRRIAKPDVLFAMHVHYHLPTVFEPIEINDKLFIELFGWVKNLHIVCKSQQNFSCKINDSEQFVLWSNI